MSQGRHRVVIVGGGFGGVRAARALARTDVDITIVDRTNHHLFQPLLYQVATGILPDGLIAPALRSVVSKQANARVVLADVQHLDLDGRVVHALAPDGQKLMLSYDSLVVAAGCTDAYFGHDEWAVFAPGLKTLEDAGHLRSHILGAFEMAELATDPAERAAYLTFAVIGAGPTGVEVVGQIAELAHETLRREYRSVATTEAKILLIEAGPQVLATFAPKLQRYTQRRLRRMGVEVMLNTMARDMDSGSVTVTGPDGGQAHSGPDKNLGGRGPGLTAGGHPGRGDRCRHGPGGPGRGAARLQPARSPRGLRDRGHGPAERPAGGGPARDPGRHLRGKADPRPAGRRDRNGTIRVPGQGQHGHYRPPVRRHRRVRDEVHRRDRLHDVGIRSRALPGRLGQPGSRRSQLGTGADLQQEPSSSDHHLRTRAERAGRAPLSA